MDEVAYEYKFSYANRKGWIALINRGFNEKTGTVVLKIDRETSINRKIKFGDNDELTKFLDIMPTATECILQFGPMWTETLFWNSLPTIETWLKQQIPAPESVEKCQAAVNAIIAYKKNRGLLENREHTSIDIPFEHIKWIMCEVHKTFPVETLYYSPSEPVVHVSFKSGSEYRITPHDITSCGEICFHLNKGFEAAYRGERPWTDEMEADFVDWVKRQDNELFKLR